jgi:predicted phage-related endonuclease
VIDHNLRRLAIGGSDIAALFGADGFKDAFSVWAGKKGGLELEPQTPNMMVGKILEPAILRLYEHIMEREVSYCDITYQHPIRPFQVYSPDGLVVGQRLGVEAKAVFWDKRADWGWETDEMPDRVLFQCWWYMSAMDYPQWDVVALLGEGLPRIYTVERLDARREETMLRRAEEWWLRYLVGDERPPLGNGDDAARWLQKTYPKQKADVREATAEEVELLEQYVLLRLAQRELVRDRNGLELAIKDAIREHEGLRWEGGRFTWRKAKDKEWTDWQSMAIALLHNFVKDEQERAVIEARYEHTKTGSRRIHINHPLLNRPKRGDSVDQETEETTV